MRNQLKVFILAFSVLGLMTFYQNCSNGMAPMNLDQNSTDAANLSVGEAEVRSMSILQNRCAVCHNADLAMGEIGYITDINALQYYRLVVKYEPLLSPLYTVLQDDEDHMGLISQSENDTLYKWISEGLGSGGAGGVTPPTTVPLAATFASIRANILVPKCSACHTPNAGNNNMPASGLNMSTHQTFTTSKPGVIVAGSPGTSRIMPRIQSTDPAFRMPRNAPAPLSPQEIQAISDWILNGALNN